MDNENNNLEFTYAGFWTRFLAVVLDSLVLWAVAAVLFDPLRVILSVQYDLFSLIDLVELIVGFAYYVILTYVYGQTLGKMVLGIKVISQDTETLTLKTVIVREVLGKLLSAIVLLIGYIIAAFDPKKRAWHDRIAKTYVVKKASNSVNKG